jgi:diacylglycerol kinase family enzyme
LRITLTVDGAQHTYRTPLVFAINNAFQLDQMGLGGRECIEAGKLVVMVAPNTSRFGLLWNAAMLAFGMAKKETDYHMHCGTEIDIEMRRKSRPVARDGELGRMKGPLKLRIQRDALNLIVPADLDREVR